MREALCHFNDHYKLTRRIFSHSNVLLLYVNSRVILSGRLLSHRDGRYISSHQKSKQELPHRMYKIYSCVDLPLGFLKAMCLVTSRLELDFTFLPFAVEINFLIMKILCNFKILSLKIFTSGQSLTQIRKIRTFFSVLL